MRLKPNLIESIILIIICVWFLINSTLSYLEQSNPGYIPLIFFFIFFILISIITIMAKYRKYYNKTSYLVVTALFLVIMWIISLIQPIPPKLGEITYPSTIYYAEIGLVTLLIIALVIFTFKEWEKSGTTKES